MAKVNSDQGDTHRDGDRCTVLGSIKTPLGLGYFVEWDDMPGVPVYINAERLKAGRS